ncbi:MAG: CoA transferase, partial [Acetobacteraceae bacterium]|nr:CoA transferase [Acetobacteraceae bacterium]
MGPTAGLVFAEFGADVIKVEPAPRGDHTRGPITIWLNSSTLMAGERCRQRDLGHQAAARRRNASRLPAWINSPGNWCPT